jgi:bacterioferritin
MHTVLWRTNDWWATIHPKSPPSILATLLYAKEYKNGIKYHVSNQLNQIITIPQNASPKPYDKYRVSEPYPDICVAGKNPYYTQLLFDDYAGKVSETTAIMQYVHHHMEMEAMPLWQEVADLEKGISIVEMKHLEMLGETIILLGGIPRYCDGRQQPWVPHYIEYQDFDPCAQLREDIKGEHEAIHQYQAHIQMIQDPFIQCSDCPDN